MFGFFKAKTIAKGQESSWKILPTKTSFRGLTIGMKSQMIKTHSLLMIGTPNYQLLDNFIAMTPPDSIIKFSRYTYRNLSCAKDRDGDYIMEVKLGSKNVWGIKLEIDQSIPDNEIRIINRIQ